MKEEMAKRAAGPKEVDVDMIRRSKDANVQHAAGD